jgi:hypothetical protein
MPQSGAIIRVPCSILFAARLGSSSATVRRSRRPDTGSARGTPNRGGTGAQSMPMDAHAPSMEASDLAYTAIPLTCWLRALIAIPRKPPLGNEVEEMVYARLLGRQQSLVLLALATTALVFFVHIASPPRSVASQQAAPAQQICFDGSAGPVTCYTPRSDGAWVWQNCRRTARGGWWTCRCRPPGHRRRRTGIPNPERMVCAPGSCQKHIRHTREGV